MVAVTTYEIRIVRREGPTLLMATRVMGDHTAIAGDGR
jgi:hypothetical protein